MSISFMALAWKIEMPSGRKLVLLSLCDHANSQGECFPSVEALAHKCSMGLRTVQQHIGDLERAGLLVRRFRKGRSTLYQLDARNFCSPAEGVLLQASTSVAKPGVLPAQLLRSIPANPAPISISDPSANRQVVRGTCLPAEWALPDSWATWALQEQPTWTAAHLHFVAEKFRDYWIALPGRRGMKTDWQAAWRNWCRNEKRFEQNLTTSHSAWRRRDADLAKSVTFTPRPLPGESLPAFNARVRQDLANPSQPVRPRTAPPEIGYTTPSAKVPVSPENRAAALHAARSLKSCSLRQHQVTPEFGLNGIHQ